MKKLLCIAMVLLSLLCLTACAEENTGVGDNASSGASNTSATTAIIGATTTSTIAPGINEDCKKTEHTDENGVLIKEEFFDKTGALISQKDYEYHENGKTKKIISTEYTLGVKSRIISEEFDENGEKIFSLSETYISGTLQEKVAVNYKNGLAVRFETERPAQNQHLVQINEYYDSKNLKSESVYKEGKLSGKHECYDSETPKTKYTFSAFDLREEERYYSETGLTMHNITFFNPDNTISKTSQTEFYASGLVKCENITSYGISTGKLAIIEISEYYDAADNHKKYYKLINHDKDGIIIRSTEEEYYASGTIQKRTVTDYSDGIKFSADITEFDETGKQTGTALIKYDKNGNPIIK
jgi:hypothetical protein